MTGDDQHPFRGLDLGYARVSTVKQNLDRQLDALAAAGIPDRHIYTDKKTGASVHRDALTALLAYARLLKAQGDSLGAIATKTGIPKTSLHRYLGQSTAQYRSS